MRLEGSLSSSLPTSCCRPGEYWLVSIGSGVAVTILKASWQMLLPLKGGASIAASYSITPRLQTSVAKEYLSWFTISGLMYSGEPTQVFAKLRSSSAQEMPKSPSNRSPPLDLKKQFSGFTSRCTTPWLWQWCSACPICATQVSTSPSGRRWPSRACSTFRRSPPEQNSMTRQSMVPALQSRTSANCVMKGQFREILRMRRASLKAASRRSSAMPERGSFLSTLCRVPFGEVGQPFRLLRTASTR
mmetsp:Transcript_25939/g.74399  ORF Transcript_25939/g.74399 Transcript_25939/m.74399 type:complete len:245 (-) Transcript_25939:129-863(-)